MKGILVALFACLVLVQGRLAPLVHYDSVTKIENQYIVVMHENTTEAERDVSIAKTLSLDDGILINTYHIGTFIGYAAVFSDEALAFVRSDPLVAYVEVDQTVHALQITSQPGCPNWGPPSTSAGPAWNGDATYRYYTHGARGVDIYVIDTGVLCTHNDLRGRCTLGVSYVSGTAEDCNGHGTHVASSAAGTICGIAKQASVTAVRVLDCNGSGSTSGVISGVNWVTQRHTNSRKSVANMSLGGSVSAALNSAVASSVRAGVLHVVAAGNSNNDACSGSPSGEPLAFTVGATTRASNRDVRASFSSFGRCLNVFAPGQGIYGAWIGTGGNTYNTISGTSMASPHVAGQAAMFMYESTVSGPAIVDDVKTKLVNTAHKDIIDLRCTTSACLASPNLMLHNGMVSD